jgi:phosphatidylglycerol:prolipoprotein diacylglycerol transferase
MGIAFIVIGLLVFGLGLAYLISFERKKIKDRLSLSFTKKEWLYYVLSIVALGAGSALMGAGVFFLNPGWGESGRAGYMSLFVIGLFFFAVSMGTLWSGFIFHYYKPKMASFEKKLFTWLMFGSIPLAVAFFLMFMEGVAPFFSYPLVAGFYIDGSGFHLYKAGSPFPSASFHVAWYGVIILFGVFVAYWISDHKFYKEFHKHGILDSLVLWAFPAGIIGARIWYVVGNWHREGFDANFAKVFAISDGGLTILGGAFAGILVGWLFIKIRRKYVDPRWAIDVCVPTVLLAQAIGRWGNFFNNEVYGQTVSLSNGWSWLPTWISSQMHFDGASGAFLAEGMINVPLFLIEGILNVAGYFIIVFAIGKGLKKFLVRGDLCGFYFIWYGVVRFIMEPMRNSTYNMGNDNSWSIINSIMYILLGVGLIVFFHLHDYALKHKDKRFILPLAGGVISFAALFFPFLNSLNSSYSSYSSITVLNKYLGFDLLFGGKAPALLVAYILIIIGCLSLFLASYFMKKENEKMRLYLLVGGSALLLIGSAMFFLGKGWTSLPKSSESGSEIAYSLSYGFAFLAALGIFGAVMGVDGLLVLKDAKKQEEIKAIEVVE